MRYDQKYNRIHNSEMWEDNWVVDSHGNLVLQEEGITVENMRFAD